MLESKSVKHFEKSMENIRNKILEKIIYVRNIDPYTGKKFCEEIADYD